MNLIEQLRRGVLGQPMEAPPELPEDAVPERVVIRKGRAIPWIGGLLARMGRPAAAVTLGRTIIVHPSARLTRSLLAHELEHVRQWNQDRLFPLKYSWETLRHGYTNNKYEKQARQVAAAYTPTSERTQT